MEASACCCTNLIISSTDASSTNEEKERRKGKHQLLRQSKAQQIGPYHGIEDLIGREWEIRKEREKIRSLPINKKPSSHEESCHRRKNQSARKQSRSRNKPRDSWSAGVKEKGEIGGEAIARGGSTRHLAIVERNPAPIQEKESERETTTASCLL